jgi:hypothetical protein
VFFFWSLGPWWRRLSIYRALPELHGPQPTRPTSETIPSLDRPDPTLPRDAKSISCLPPSRTLFNPAIPSQSSPSRSRLSRPCCELLHHFTISGPQAYATTAHPAATTSHPPGANFPFESR